MKPATKTEPIKRAPVEDWVEAVARQIRACAQERSFGTLRIEFYNGEIRRLLLERAVIDPKQLAPLDDRNVD